MEALKNGFGAIVAILTGVAMITWIGQAWSGSEAVNAGELRLISKAHAASACVLANDLQQGGSVAPDDKPEPQGDDCENCYGTGRSGDDLGTCIVCGGTGKRTDGGSLPKEPAKVKCDNPNCGCEDCDCEDCDCGKAAKQPVKIIYMHTLPNGYCPPCEQWKKVELPKITPETGWKVEIVEGGSRYGSYPSFRVYKDASKTGVWVKGYKTFDELKALAK